MKTRAKVIISAMAVALAVMAGGVAPANAVSGYGYDGTDPSTGATNCVTGSTAIYPAPIRVGGTGASVGTMQVWYSPSCGTNWVRAYTGSSYTQVIKTSRREPNTPPFTETETDFGAGWSYSMQVYAPGATCVHADTVILGPSGDFYAWAGVNLC